MTQSASCVAPSAELDILFPNHCDSMLVVVGGDI
jgi:hypothetical protein